MGFKGVKVYLPIYLAKNTGDLSELLSPEELERIPLRYRWLLKLFLKFPNPSFPYFVLRRLPWIDGIFWALVVPVLLTLYFFFGIWLVGYLSLYVLFPFNVILGLSIPGLILIIFLRVQIERSITAWRSFRSSTLDWDIPKAVDEYYRLAKKKRRQS